jgi:hypothetical protein
MKQKAGLGKKVSSIFDGVALPNIARPTEPTVPPAAPQAPPPFRPTDIVSPPRPMQVAPPMPPKTAAVAVPQPPRTIPAQPPQLKTSAQPQPSRHNSSSVSTVAVSENSWQQSIYKMFFSGNGEADARNKKALAMVGMLSVTFFVIASWTGLFSGSPKGAITNSTVATAAASNETRIDWTPPEPYPSNLRDPMQVGSVSKAGNGGDSASGFGGFVVKSIVFSVDNPTAVINGQIVKTGKIVNGATVTKINKDSVEFTANGKSWKQQVE